MEVAVCFCINDGYAQHLSVALASLLENNKSCHFDIRVLSRDLSDDSKIRIQELGEWFSNFSITYIAVHEELYHEFSSALEHVSIDAYLRYYIPELCPDLDKALYLDVDLIVCGNIEKLWNADISGYYVAGVADGLLNTDEYKQKIGLPTYLNYINTGVLLMNLKHLREGSKVQELVETTKNRPELLKYCDQDVINYVINDGIKYLPSKFNFDSNRFFRRDKYPSEVVVVHFTGPEKPWLYHRYLGKNCISKLKRKYRYQSAIRRLYNKYLKYGGFSDFEIMKPSGL